MIWAILQYMIILEIVCDPVLTIKRHADKTKQNTPYHAFDFLLEPEVAQVRG